MRVCILGAGGLGSVIGGYLAETGVDVTLIGRPAHMEAIKRDGLQITGRRGDHLVRENLTPVTHPDQAVGEFDYLMLIVKGRDTQAALEQADRLKERVATVCSLQNGIGKEETLAAWAGRKKVLGASIIEGGTLEAPGKVSNTISATYTAYFGELDNTNSPRAQAIAEAFTKAGLPTRAVDCIHHVLWEKLTQIANASSWVVSTLAGNPELAFPEGLAVREGVEHYVALGRELLSIYTAMGYTPQGFYAPMSRLKTIYDAGSFEAAVEAMMAYGEDVRRRYAGRVRTSMHEDVMRGKKTEVDLLIKPFVDKARELDIPIPTLLAAYRIIKVLDHYLK